MYTENGGFAQIYKILFPCKVYAYRSSWSAVFCKKVLLKNFAKFTGKHLRQISCNFVKIETLAQVFSCEFYEIFKNTYFY